MVSNFFLVTLRNIFNNKIYSFISIGNLALGFASSILIFLFVFDELSYDRFNEKADRIYRINARGMFGNTAVHQTYTCAPLPAAMMNDYAEVESIVRILYFTNNPVEVRYEGEAFTETSVAAADSNFFRIFTFPLLKGNPDKALLGPGRIVISEKAAKKYFGDQDPIGKNLRLNGNNLVGISGVMKNMPHNSHFHFDFIVSLTSMPFMLNDQWMNNNFQTYLLLKKGADAKALEAKFPAFVKKYVFPDQNQYKKFTEAGNSWEYFLQAITSVHLTSDLNGEFEANGNMTYVIIFTLAGLFMIIIAGVNFTNLSTAKSEKRSREVAIRKVMGSTRRRLVTQFLWESVFFSLFALLVALILVALLIQSFNSLTGKVFSVNDLLSGPILLSVVVAAAGIGILAGLYPAFFLSSYHPTSVLKSGQSVSRSNSKFRGVLVIIQFFISVSLITGTLVIYRQLRYFQKKNLGFDKSKIVIVEGVDKLNNNFGVFRDKLLAYHSIKSVAGSSTIPGRAFNNWAVLPEGREGLEQMITLNTLQCDTAFLNTYGMTMAEGRFFSPLFPSDSLAIIINKNAADLLGWKPAAGKKIRIFGETAFTVIGVINDFHYESFHQTIRPMGMIRISSMFRQIPQAASVKITGEDPKETISFIRSQWESMGTGLPFVFSFFDQDYQQLFQNEIKTGSVFFAFSVFAIIIAALGLFALSSYLIEKRTREIGIHKVNGASSVNIMVLLSSDYIRWVLIAILFAVPMAWYGMGKWLENFAYKTTMPYWIFLLSAIFAIAVAWAAVGIQTIKASRQNPANSLRYE